MAMTKMEGITFDESEIELNQYSENFLQIWLSMMFYKSSSGLSKMYGEFVDDSGEFSKEKYEKFLGRIVTKIRKIEINIPKSPNIEDILNTDIENFSDETHISWGIANQYSGINFVEDENKVRKGIKEYYEEKIYELKDKADLVDFTVDDVRELVTEILEGLGMDLDNHS